MYKYCVNKITWCSWFLSQQTCYRSIIRTMPLNMICGTLLTVYAKNSVILLNLAASQYPMTSLMLDPWLHSWHCNCWRVEQKFEFMLHVPWYTARAHPGSSCSFWGRLCCALSTCSCFLRHGKGPSGLGWAHPTINIFYHNNLRAEVLDHAKGPYNSSSHHWMANADV